MRHNSINVVSLKLFGFVTKDIFDISGSMQNFSHFFPTHSGLYSTAGSPKHIFFYFWTIFGRFFVKNHSLVAIPKTFYLLRRLFMEAVFKQNYLLIDKDPTYQDSAGGKLGDDFFTNLVKLSLNFQLLVDVLEEAAAITYLFVQLAPKLML